MSEMTKPKLSAYELQIIEEAKILLTPFITIEEALMMFAMNLDNTKEGNPNADKVDQLQWDIKRLVYKIKIFGYEELTRKSEQ